MIASSLTELGTVLHLRGKPDEAQPHLEQALAICQQVLGPDHHLTAQSMARLAAVLCDQNEITRARTLYERALAIFESQFGPEHAEAIEVREQLGGLTA